MVRSDRAFKPHGKLIALALVAMLWLTSGPGIQFAHAEDADLTVPVAFTTAASGLVPAESAEVNVAIVTIELTAAEPATAILEYPGFAIVLSGSVTVITTAGEPAAVLGTSDAHWLDAGDQVRAHSDSTEATIWLVQIGADANARNLGGSNPYTFTLSPPDTGGTNPHSPYVVRIGAIPANSSTSLGSEGDRIVYVFSLAGNVSVDGTELSAGAYASPFFDQPGIQTGDEAALFGYIARGSTVDPATP